MPSSQWFKGNTHTHTDASDGDALLHEVADWYQSHGYDFLVITDHNRVTDISGWSGDRGALLLVPGCEVSLSSEGKPVHINHPNFKWAFADDHLRAITNYRLLEVFNGSTDCNNHGGGGHPGVEEIWDRLLTAGQRIWAVASDDAHDLHGEIWEDLSPPGRAWVMVRAEASSARAILQAMEHIGAGGQTLAIAHGLEAVYRPRGHEGYVRARVTSSNGGTAWTQPQFLR